MEKHSIPLTNLIKMFWVYTATGNLNQHRYIKESSKKRRKDKNSLSEIKILGEDEKKDKKGELLNKGGGMFSSSTQDCFIKFSIKDF
jgi:hypothetical protein